MFSKVEEISKIINKYDPIQLLELGWPVDEYIPEAEMVYSMWNDSLSFYEFHDKLYEIFSRQFSWLLKHPHIFFLPMAKELWSYMKMNESV